VSDYFGVRGAKVLAGGLPSGALERRLRGALALSRASTQARFLTTGAVGEHPPAEAVVMRDWLMARGVAEHEIVLDEEATDTVSSVRNCTRILRRRADAERIVVCSDRFHVPRCTILFRIAGLRAEAGEIESGRSAMGSRRWLYYWCRDLTALIWDAPQALVDRILDRPAPPDSTS
jgi:uncharacterized SAM-binding protein YcdF (DUF218 family)